MSYNANGGSGAPSDQTKTYGVSLTLSSTKPTRSGYTFLGWATSSTATNATYQPGGSFTTNATTTLYAVWKANTYTISYNANGGSGAPSSQTKIHGVSLILSSTKPTRTGYTFLGWSTSSTASGASYYPGGSFTANTNTVLFAVWKKNYDSGDTTGDGKITSDDALLTLQHCVGKISLLGDAIIAADVDGGSDITSSDALLILQYAVKKINEFPFYRIY